MYIDLTPEHWVALRFMRAYYDEHGAPADARFVMRHLRETCGAAPDSSRHIVISSFILTIAERTQ